MKRIIGLVLVSLFFVGCTENVIQPEESAVFENLKPVVNRDSINALVPLEKALECLNLTRDQRVIVDSFLRESKLCTIECKKEYNKGIREIQIGYKIEIEKYRGLRETPEIKKEIQNIKAVYREKQRQLNITYRGNMGMCYYYLLKSIDTVLNPDQLTLWNIWKATGKIPCGVKP